MAAAAGASSDAREYWRQISARIHEEEQQLKELQLDYSERVAVVEGLKIELRQLKHDVSNVTSKEARFAQATAASVWRQQELTQQAEAAERDRKVLAEQLAAEQARVAAEAAKLLEARTLYQQQLAEQRAHVQGMRQQMGSETGASEQGRQMPGEEHVQDDIVVAGDGAMHAGGAQAAVAVAAAAALEHDSAAEEQPQPQHM